jgi:four helix bundle protein
MDKYEMQRRMMNLAIAVIKLTKVLPISQESKVITYQIIKSASSTAANYRAACRAKSTKDFISKMGIVEEECDETAFWLELVEATALAGKNEVAPLLKEASEIVAMTVRSIKTAKESLKEQKSNGKPVESSDDSNQQ